MNCVEIIPRVLNATLFNLDVGPEAMSNVAEDVSNVASWT
jgi:hypothetical protein